MTASELLSPLTKRGYQWRIVSINHLDELHEEIEGPHRQGLYDEEFYKERIVPLVFKPPTELKDARSLILMTSPQPQFRVIFSWKGEKRPALIPPTYVRYKAVKAQAKELLEGILGPAGYRVAAAFLPEKLLVARSGLGAYGKNNISYVPGMGSFHEPAVFYSDLPCAEDNWLEKQMLKKCQKCSACVLQCPSGAITSERFLLRVERCITFRNEKAGTIQFPGWLDPSWHNCLVGCMICQQVCPENKKFLKWIEDGPEFTEEETGLILQGIPFEKLPATAKDKWKWLGLSEDFDVFPRNLRALLRESDKVQSD
jgi:epoxyqueuosine reductase